jgi:hypothetical protein
MKSFLMATTMSVALGLGLAGMANAQDRPRVSRTQGEAALEVMGLMENAGDALSYDRRRHRNGVFTFTNIVVQVPEAEGGEQEYESIHIGQMVVQSPRLNADGHVLMYAFEMEDISFHEDEASEGGDVLTIERVSLEQPNSSMSADFVEAFTSTNSDFDLSWENYEFGAFAIEGVHFSAPDAEAVEMEIDRMALNDFDQERLGRFELLGFDMNVDSSTGPVSFSLSEISADDFLTSAYADMMKAISSDAGEQQIMAAYQSASASHQLDMFSSIAVRGLRVALPGMTLSMDALTADMASIAGRTVAVADMGSLSLVPKIGHPEGMQIAGALGMLGYEELDVSMHSRTVYDEASGRMYSEGDNYIQLNDGFRLELSQDYTGYQAYLAALGNMSPNAGESDDPEVVMAELAELFGPLVVNNVNLRLTDLSILERAIDAGAAAQGQTPEQMRMGASAMVMMGMASAPPALSPELTSEAAAALSAFIGTGGSLIVDMSPNPALRIGDYFASFNAKDPDLGPLGLSVSHEPPAQ